MGILSIFKKKSHDEKLDTVEIPDSWKASKASVAEGLKAYSDKVEKYTKRFQEDS